MGRQLPAAATAGLAFAGLAFAGLAACEVQELAVDKRPTVVNSCDSIDDCAGGSCRDGRCVASRTSYTEATVVVSIPRNGASDYAGLVLSQGLDLGATSGTGDVDLDPPAVVSGTITPEAEAGCRHDFSAERARAVFYPRRTGALSFEPITASVECTAGDCARGRFDAVVPAGTYDLYVAPEPGTDDSAAGPPEGVCAFVPRIVFGQTIESATIQLELALAAPEVFTVRVTWPQGPDAPSLAGWQLDLADPGRGLRLSRIVTLDDTPTDDDGVRYSEVTLRTTRVTAESEPSAGTEVVRLTPPADVTAPTILTERAALELFPGGAVIASLSSIAAPVTYQGRVLRNQGEQAVEATVSLVAQEVAGVAEGTIASFSRTVTTDAEGRFEVDLVPGRYFVHGVARGVDALASRTDSWDVAAAPEVQAGKELVLDAAARLTGSVGTPAGESVPDGSIQATPVRTASDPGLLDRVLGDGAFASAPRTATLTASGTFELFTDSGQAFDLSVRPPDGSGFAWLVLPGVPVPDEQGTFKDLGDLRLPLPVELRGVLRVDGRVLPGATMTVHVPVPGQSDDGTTPVTRLVAVAAGQADDAGRFELRLPVDLD